MTYSISEVKKKFSISDSTLRYYEKAGLIFNIEKDNSGRRIYSQSDLDWISLIICMRKTGMGIQDIRYFTDLCKLGNDSLEERLRIFKTQRAKIDEQLKILFEYSNKVDAKINHYQNLLDKEDK